MFQVALVLGYLAHSSSQHIEHRRYDQSGGKTHIPLHAIASVLLSLSGPARPDGSRVANPRDHLNNFRRSLQSAGLPRRTLLGFSAIGLLPGYAHARPEGVNKPELLPAEQTNVIDLQKFLTTGQKAKLEKKIEAIEKNTGFKLHVLTQSYPETPGLAIKDYWKLDDRSLVMIVDKGFGFSKNRVTQANILNFNAAEGFDLQLPPIFFTRLRNTFGVKDFVDKNGEDAAILQTIDTIDFCLRQDEGCSDVPLEFKNPSMAMYGDQSGENFLRGISR